MEDSPKVYFVQVSDTHFGNKRSYKRTEKLVEAINSLPLDIVCVVVTGDIMDDNIRDEEKGRRALTILKNLRMPVHIMPGNHDILLNFSRCTSIVYREVFGSLVSCVEYAGVVFFFWFVEPLIEGYTVEEFDPIESLHTVLNMTMGKPIILFVHTPPTRTMTNPENKVEWPDQLSRELKLAVNKYKIVAIIGGHYHCDQFQWFENVPVYVCPAFSEADAYHVAFRIYEYNEGPLSYHTVYLASPKTFLNRLQRRVRKIHERFAWK